MSFDQPKDMNLDGSDHSICIIAARFNEELVDGLVKNAISTLMEHNVDEDSITLVRVPGSNELPFAASIAARSGEFDCIVVLGVVVKGETPHYEIISNSSAYALHNVSIGLEIPVINGIVVTNDEAQARERCLGGLNRGKEFALAALEMCAFIDLVAVDDEMDDILADMEDDEEEALGDFLEEDDDGNFWKS